MRIKITTTFLDKQSDDPDVEVPAGTEMTVTADRGAELVGLGVAVDISPKEPRAAAKLARKRAKPAAKTATPAPAPIPAADPAPDTPPADPADA
jgi:hypothetical protein